MNIITKTMTQILSRIYSDIYRIRYAIIILVLYFVFTQNIFGTVCPFAILTGIACPACGLTRAAFLVLTGKFIAAAQLNVTIYLWLPFLLYLCTFRYVLNKKSPFAIPLIILVCLATIGYYLWNFTNGTLIEITYPGILPLFFPLCTPYTK